MHWLDGFSKSDSLPAVWLVATGQTPRTRPERSALRAAVSRRLAAIQLGIDDREIALGHDAAGRPSLTVAGAATPQLSHATRAGFVAVALADGTVGVDVEEVGAGPIPMQALHRAEQLWLAQLAEGERERAFAQLWAAKEAYGKWLGVGLAEPDSHAILPGRDGAWVSACGADVSIAVRLVQRAGIELAVAVAVTKG
jgi:phosphopantetheinyl transferase